MIELEQADEEPRFEFTVENRVAHDRVIGGIPLLGKPDIWFKTKAGNQIILDWKVNGYCGNKPTSPKKGYLRVCDGWTHSEDKPQSKNNKQQHKDCQPMIINGIQVNIAHYLEEVDVSWANQTTIYMWIMGEDVGTKAIVGIDQLCGVPRSSGLPDIRVATHRERVSPAHQEALMLKIEGVWKAVQTGIVFDEDNEAQCAKFDNMYRAFEYDPNDPNVNVDSEEWFKGILGR